MRRCRYIARIWMMMAMLLVGGVAGEAWAAKVTYHILTLPIPDPSTPGNYDYHMKSEVVGHRLEALKIVVEGNTVELPAHYKSPLATGFTYYEPKDIEGHGGSAVQLYQDVNTAKGVLYDVKASPTPVAEGTPITTVTEYYVTYTYNASNTIVQLDGSVNYNISVKNKGFVSLNRGRNNRFAMIPTEKVNPDILSKWDFSYIASPHKDITTYWSDGNNWNSRDSTESKFFFIFNFEGNDPYHIVLRTSYDRNYTYIEKNEDGDKAFVYKWYKGGIFMTSGTGTNTKAYLASDDHVRYTSVCTNKNNPNPTDPASVAKTGYFHGNKNIWSTLALLNNTNGTGYVFMGTRTVDGNGALSAPTDNKYNYLNFYTNDLKYVLINSSEATNNHTVEALYPLKKVTFKIATPFYKIEASSDHIVSAPTEWVSQYTVDNDPIETKYLPAVLERKYCNYTGKFYSDPACENEITHFSQATEHPTEGYQVYVGYERTSALPFDTITPATTYSASTWEKATWYELTDEGSEQVDGLKLKYDDGTKKIKNNGADGSYSKATEFAFIGDPYELRVVYRDSVQAAENTSHVPYYVGATGTPSSPTDLNTSKTATDGYKWEIPADVTTGSFLLRKYKGDGYWSWNPGHPSPVDINYTAVSHADTYNVPSANAQTVTFNVSNLTFDEGNYLVVTVGGTNTDQATVQSEKIYVYRTNTATFTVAIKARGNSDKQFTLSIQEKKGSDNSSIGDPFVVTVNQTATDFTANTVQYSTANSTRMKVMELPKVNFTYNIVDTHGNIAVKATVKQTIFSSISGYTSIPEVICSPFLYDEDVTFWRTYTDGVCTNEIHETFNTTGNIYVKYTVSHLSTKSIKLDNEQQFKVNLNEEYLYYDGTSSKVLSTKEAQADASYSWRLEGGDPYAMKIRNMGNNQYVKVDGGTWGDNKALAFEEDIDDGSRFVAMMSLYTGIYEVLAATGTTDYYHIGRPSTTGAETKIYSTSTYAHGTAQLQFELAGETAITYHLIDKTKTELLKVSSYNPRLTLPSEFVSPLVGEYHYYPTKAKALTDLAGDRITEIKDDTYEDDTKVDGKGDNHVYVTYTINDIVTFSTGQYMLKFLDPAADGYYLEDGNDKLTTGKIQAVYPYCNGDGNLNIYGADMQNEQFNGGASTRPRWVWYFDSPTSDPYHVRIKSKSTINYNGKQSTFLTTYAVHFNQDTGEDAKKKRIVTGGTLPGAASVQPMEYMVLGTPGHYKLLTTDTLKVDLNGDGDFDDVVDGVSEKSRQYVKSFEQYWKTYNMLKLHVLGMSKSTNAYSDDTLTWVIPDSLRSTLETRLGAIGVGTGKWHSYKAYANATRWNGYNDKEAGKEKKVVENLEHWFQTFDMGNGTFDIESADIPPVLVLLDLHGWEIMRRPLPPAETYPEGEELAALRVYDSPLVDKYYFYSNATKATGCHKYSLRLNDDKTERDQVKVNGVRYSSNSLGDLPSKSATGVVSGGAIQDLYVIYTVKEEYDKNYSYTFTGNSEDSTYTETWSSQPYLVLQNARFYKTKNTSNDNPSYFTKPIHEHTNPEGGNVYDLIVSPKNHGGDFDHILSGGDTFIGNIFWQVKPNQNIDDEMGIDWVKVTGVTNTDKAKYVLKKEYWDNKKSGFDPYNIQFQLLKNNDGTSSSLYLTSHMDTARLDNGIMVGDYSGTGSTTKLTLAAAGSATVDCEGYDHTTVNISNQTFMAVSDVNGNMQLMPRFDHTLRVDQKGTNPWDTELLAPVDHAKANVEKNNSMGPQTTFFVTPKRFHYHIIDNNGREALRYKRAADFYPTITDHFKSPIAKDFAYYSGLADYDTPFAESSVGEWGPAPGQYKRTLTRASMLDDAVKLLPNAGTYFYRIGTRGDFSYKKVTVTKGLNEQHIASSFAEANVGGIYDDVDCQVYVRYDYNLDADIDADRLLQGQWYTVQLAGKDLQDTGKVVVPYGDTQGTGVGLFAGEDDSRSLTAADEDDVDTQAKKLTATGGYYFKQKDAENYWLVNVTVAYNGSVDATYTKTEGSYATKWSDSKPLVIGSDDKKWQWKFFVAPADSASDYYVKPDPYAIHLFNRYSNYTKNPSEEPSPMAVGIKVPNADGGVDRFALLSHPSGGYALVVAKAYDNNYRYQFLNGENMTLPDAVSPQAADTAAEAGFNYKSGAISNNARVVVNHDVTHQYTYYVITNDNKLAIVATQTAEEAESHGFNPYVPESAQSPLLNMADYKYYGFRMPGDPYRVIPQTILSSLCGLYDDSVYVRYNAYNIDTSPFKVPNKKTTSGGHVARDPQSIDVAMNIDGGLPYNIIWYNDNMMKASGATVTYESDHKLSGDNAFVWYFIGNDPYALKIKHKGDKYIAGTDENLVAEGDAPTFMMLKKDGYNYGILQKTSGSERLSGYGQTLTDDDPNHYIIFGLSIHDLIYHLIIAKTCPDKSNPKAGEYIDIDYREAVSGTLNKKRIYGTTQRDLLSQKDGAGKHVAGEKYQLGDTITWNDSTYTYCYDAGSVSIGDALVLPDVFSRPNCTFEFYVEGIYQHFAAANVNEGKPHTDMNNKYKGLNLNKLMSDEQLIDQTVVINIVYEFDTTLATNTGLGFVTSTDQNLWYTYETYDGTTPYLAQYTNAWGLQSKQGRDTRYTNDYLWTPLGDVYGFKMYNRYMLKNSGGVKNVMTMSAIEEGKKLLLAEPSTTEKPTIYPAGYEVFELVAGDGEGYFRVHPVVNNAGTNYYVSRKTTSGDVDGDGKDDLNYTILSATPSDWRFGLDMTLLEPYYERAGYVGGLTTNGKAAYERVMAKDTILFTDLQAIVYNDDSIVSYKPGYYRLHSQPGVSGINPVRYASGYLHKVELTGDGDIAKDTVPMHFFSRDGVSAIFKGDEDDLGSGFTNSTATRGEIPIDPTENDPSTIFYFNGTGTLDGNPRSTIQTQGLYVAADANGDAAKGAGASKKQRAVMSANPQDSVVFSLMDIGGAVLLIHDGSAPATRRYLNYDQTYADSIYDLKFYHESPTDDAKWCMQPVQKTATAGDGEMPLLIDTHQGGDGYYYATFCAPFDVLLPNDKNDSTYNAYTCSQWYDDGVHPVAVPALASYPEGKYVPAGTPVIIRVKDESGVLQLTLPSSAPSSALSCIFSGVYLEQLLEVDAEHDVYTLGVPMTSEVTNYDRTTGDITAPTPEFASSGVGFYINATPNKEVEPYQTLWKRNNNYVLHNKIYYREGSSSGARSPKHIDGPEYVPVIFGDEDVENPENPNENQSQQRVSDGCVYDILGRKVATEQDVKNGKPLSPGIYIIDGKKISIM